MLRASQSTPAPTAGDATAPETRSRYGNGQLADMVKAGAPMPLPYQDEMESAFGEDFSGTRATVAPVGDAGAGALAAGDDVAFASSSPDRSVVAHELAHVVQHRNAGDAGGGVSAPGDASEVEADHAAAQVASGGLADVTGASGGVHGDWLGRAAHSLGLMSDDELTAREVEEFQDEEYDSPNFHPSTGMGLFDGHYAPRAGLLTITVKVRFNFIDGNPNAPDFVNNATGGPHPLADFQWTDAEKTDWASHAISDIQDHWSDRYTFHNTRVGWEGLPSVDVRVVVAQTTAADAHFDIEVHKWPEDAVADNHMNAMVAAGSNHSRGVFNESADNGIENPDSSHFVRTPATRLAYNQAATANPGTIQFDPSQTAPSASEAAKLAPFKTALALPVMPPFPITVTGHASSEGDAATNQSLSEARANNVDNLLAGGPKVQPTVRGVGATGATRDPSWRKVDIAIGAFEANQRTVLHEFGHAFGLDDEYPSPDGSAWGTSLPAGTPVRHSALAQREIPGTDPIVAHHSESIMSNGEEIRPPHYATFMECLGRMTSSDGTWAIGPGGRQRAREPGAADLAPTTDGTPSTTGVA